MMGAFPQLVSQFEWGPGYAATLLCVSGFTTLSIVGQYFIGGGPAGLASGRKWVPALAPEPTLGQPVKLKVLLRGSYTMVIRFSISRPRSDGKLRFCSDGSAIAMVNKCFFSVCLSSSRKTSSAFS